MSRREGVPHLPDVRINLVVSTPVPAIARAEFTSRIKRGMEYSKFDDPTPHTEYIR